MYSMDSCTKAIAAANTFCDHWITDSSIREWTRLRGIPDEVRNNFFKGDLGSFLLPDNYGGSDASLFERIACAAQLSRRTGSVLPFFMDVTSYALLAALRRHTADHSPALECKDGRPVFAEAFVEPVYRTGDGLSTAVTQEGGHLFLDGEKTFVSNAEFSPYVVVLANDNVCGKEDKGTSLWIVPTDEPGIEIDPIDTSGQLLLAPANISFEHVELDPEWHISSEGKLNVILRWQYEIRCLFLCAISFGLARSAIDDMESFVDATKTSSQTANHLSYLDVFDSLQTLDAQTVAMELLIREACNHTEKMRYIGLHGLDCRTQKTIENADDLIHDSFNSIRSMMNFVPRNALHVAQSSIQIFGLPGYTTEFRIGRILEDCQGILLRQRSESIMLYQLFRMF